jgi:hypothetical protein
VKKQTFGFGYDPSQSQNHFYVLIPPKQGKDTAPLPVQIYERFAWNDEGEQVLGAADILRLEISKHKWKLVTVALSTEFNARLKQDSLKIGKFPASGGTPIERLLGKELMVMLWAIEDCDPAAIPTAIRNWKGLMPEERWWLYTMTNASTGGLNDKKGWRKALRYALCENPIVEKRQISMFDNSTDEDEEIRLP